MKGESRITSLLKAKMDGQVLHVRRVFISDQLEFGF